MDSVTPASSSLSPSSEPTLPLHLAGSLVRLLRGAGVALASATSLTDVTRCQVILNQFDHPGRAHVYRADCSAGTRLRVQLLTPALSVGRALTPAVAVLAQGIPAGGDALKLPVTVPAGYSAQTIAPPKRQTRMQTDALTGAGFFPGRAIDTKTLVGGRVYVVVWSPRQSDGQVCHADWTYAGSRMGAMAVGPVGLVARTRLVRSVADGGVCGVGDPVGGGAARAAGWSTRKSLGGGEFCAGRRR